MGWGTQRGPRHRLVATSHRLASCVIVSGLNGLNLVEVSQCSLCIKLLAFSLVSRHISRTQSFQQNRHIEFLTLVALKLLVSLISRLVACSARIVVDKQTHRETDRQTYRTTTVILAAHARRGLMNTYSDTSVSFL